MRIYLSRDVSKELTRERRKSSTKFTSLFHFLWKDWSCYDRYFRKSACNSAILARILIEFREKNKIKRSPW